MHRSWGRPCPPCSPRAETFQSSLISVSGACEGRQNAQEDLMGPNGTSAQSNAGPVDWAGRPVPALSLPQPRCPWLLNIAYLATSGSSMRCRFHGSTHLSGAWPTASADLPAAPSASPQLARLSRAGGLPRAISPAFSPKPPLESRQALDCSAGLRIA